MAVAGGVQQSSTPPADDWQTEWPNVLPELDQLARRGRKLPDVAVMRASQLDAARLDVELTAMLREQFMKIFSLFQPRIISALQPELTLLLDFLVFKFSVWSGKPTPGSALMNLRYRDERSVAQPGRHHHTAQVEVHPSGQHGPSHAAAHSNPAAGTDDSRVRRAAGPVGRQVAGRSGMEGPGPKKGQQTLYGLAMVLGRYAWGRLDQMAAAQQWQDGTAPGTQRRSLWVAVRWAETVFKLGSLANFIVFLRYGKYRSLLERVLRMRLVYQRVNMARAISFEYLNRQLVWHELSEVLLFLLPLINVGRLKRFVTHQLPQLKAAFLPVAGGGAARASGDSSTDVPAMPGRCVICNGAEITVPFRADPCGHIFDYYCLYTQLQEAIRLREDFPCPVCSVPVTAMRRWRVHITLRQQS